MPSPVFLTAGIFYGDTPPATGVETYFPLDGQLITTTDGGNILDLVVQLLYRTKTWRCTINVTASGLVTKTEVDGGDTTVTTVDFSLEITDTDFDFGMIVPDDETGFICPADRWNHTGRYWIANGTPGATEVGTVHWTQTTQLNSDPPVVVTTDTAITVSPDGSIIEVADDDLETTDKPQIVDDTVYLRLRVAWAILSDGDPYGVFTDPPGFLAISQDSLATLVNPTSIAVNGDRKSFTMDAQGAMNFPGDVNTVEWTVVDSALDVASSIVSVSDFPYTP